MISIDKEGILDKYFYSYDNSGLISGINRSRRDLDAVSGQSLLNLVLLTQSGENTGA